MKPAFEIDSARCWTASPGQPQFPCTVPARREMTYDAVKDDAVKDRVMMGIFGKFKDEAEQYAREHPQQGQEAGQTAERKAGPGGQQEQYGDEQEQYGQQDPEGRTSSSTDISSARRDACVQSAASDYLVAQAR